MNKPKKVRIIETGEVFDSTEKCADVVHGTVHSIQQCCRGRKKSHMGHTYEYVVDDRK